MWSSDPVSLRLGKAVFWPCLTLAVLCYLWYSLTKRELQSCWEVELGLVPPQQHASWEASSSRQAESEILVWSWQRSIGMSPNLHYCNQDQCLCQHLYYIKDKLDKMYSYLNLTQQIKNELNKIKSGGLTHPLLRDPDKIWLFQKLWCDLNKRWHCEKDVGESTAGRKLDKKKFSLCLDPSSYKWK